MSSLPHVQYLQTRLAFSEFLRLLGFFIAFTISFWSFIITPQFQVFFCTSFPHSEAKGWMQVAWLPPTPGGILSDCMTHLFQLNICVRSKPHSKSHCQSKSDLLQSFLAIEIHEVPNYQVKLLRMRALHQCNLQSRSQKHWHAETRNNLLSADAQLLKEFINK